MRNCWPLLLLLLVRCGGDHVTADAGPPGSDVPDMRTAEGGSFDLSDGTGEVTDLVMPPDGGEVSDGGIDLAGELPDVVEPPDGTGDLAEVVDVVEPLPPYEPGEYIGTDGRHFRDEAGRVILFHGVNVSNGSKSAPFFPQWLTEEHFDRLAARGINILRFLVIWEAIEPEKGLFDQAYLDMVEERVGWATERGIYVLVDMHQDVYGPKYGGDGAPLWATLDHGKEFDPPPGDWFLKYGEPAVQQAFQSFWDNEEGIRDHFIMAWQEVAKRFADDPMVVGYDLINEPYIGNWDVMDIPQFEAEVLTPFYAEVAAAIREVDDQHIIFVEPTASKGLGVIGGIGPIGDDRVAYAAHYYHLSMDMLGTYSDTKENMAVFFQQIRQEAWDMGGPPFLGEFGFYAGFPGDTEYARHQMELMEELGFSFAIWSFDPCNNGFCLLDPLLQPLWPLELLTQSYPQRIAGQLLSWHYERPTRTLTVTFDPAGFAPDAESVFFVPAVNHPLGVVATCSAPEGAECTTQVLAAAQEVRITVSDGEAGPVTVTVRPAQTYPPPLAGLSTHTALTEGPKQEQELGLEEELGVDILRTDFKWSKMEPTDDDFHVDKYDAIVANAADHDMEMLALLDYSQEWAESEPGNTSTLDVDEFAEFAGVVAEHFAEQVTWYEIWNEENTARFWKPEPDPVHYGALLKASAVAIRAKDPAAKIVFGGLASTDFFGSVTWPFLADTLHAHPDLGNYFDAVAIHPYTLFQTLAPEAENAAGTYEDMLTAATEVLSRYGLERVPLVLTEMGWPACPCPPLEPPPMTPNVSYAEQAAYLVRAYLLGWAAGIDMFLWYDFYDGSGNSDLFSEDYFGLATYDADPGAGDPPLLKPSYHACQVLLSLVDGLLFDQDLSPSADCRILRFAGEERTLYAAWRTTDSASDCTLSVPLTENEHALVSTGGGETLTQEDGPGELTFAETVLLPTYVIVETVQ